MGLSDYVSIKNQSTNIVFKTQEHKTRERDRNLRDNLVAGTGAGMVRHANPHLIDSRNWQISESPRNEWRRQSFFRQGSELFEGVG